MHVTHKKILNGRKMAPGHVKGQVREHTQNTNCNMKKHHTSIVLFKIVKILSLFI